MSYKIFKDKKINHLEQPMFFGEGVNTARYDVVKYPYLDKLIDKQLEQFWRPEEVNITKDISDWKKLTESEKHIFVSNLKRQTLLDSIQGRGPNIALLPVVSVPELETWVENWGMNETVHSRSYTYILKNLFSEPDKTSAATFFKFNSKNHENLLEKLESLSDNELLKNESRKAKKHIEQQKYSKK